MDDEYDYKLTLRASGEVMWEKQTGKLNFREDHPEYDDLGVAFAFYQPPGAEGWRQDVFPLSTLSGVSNVYAFNLDDMSNIPWRIPDLACVSGGENCDTVYTVVDLGLYNSANPLGFAEGGWQVGDNLAAHDIEIVDGRIPGVEGVMWATEEFDYGQLSGGGYKSMAGSAGLLNSAGYPGGLIIIAEHSGGITDLTAECDCGVCGDVNGDGEVNPSDVTFMVQYVYLSRDMRTQPPNCPYESGDVNCDGQTNPEDMILLVNYVYGTMPLPCQDPCD